MEMEKFCKCHGLVKDKMILTFKHEANGEAGKPPRNEQSEFKHDAIKLHDRFWAFELKDQIIMVNWNDEHTIFYVYGKDSFISLWHIGKRIYKKKCKNVDNPTIFSACLCLYDLQDEFRDTEYKSFYSL